MNLLSLLWSRRARLHIHTMLAREAFLADRLAVAEREIARLRDGWEETRFQLAGLRIHGPNFDYEEWARKRVKGMNVERSHPDFYFLDVARRIDSGEIDPSIFAKETLESIERARVRAAEAEEEA